MLGRQGALLDAAAREALPLGEGLIAGVDEVRGVLRANMLAGEEGALEVDALDVGTHEVVSARLVGLRDGPAGAADALD